MARDFIRFDDDLPEADRQVLNVIRKMLWEYEPLRATRPVIDITVKGGLVQLMGRVRTLAIKEIAEYMIHRLPDVRAVRNDLIADPEVVRAVADAFAADPDLGPCCPIVDARDGVVILAGDVPSQDLVQKAIEIAGTVETVVSVTSHLRVRDPATALPANGTLAAAGQGTS